jgi:RNA polymerase sigma-70 factor (ECF subfamily)
MQYDDREVINGCREKDRFFQEYLYKKYYSAFLKICARYARDQFDAEQLLHDGFLKIYNNMEDFQHTGSFEGWMKRIVINTCLDYLKSKYLKTAMQMNVNANIVMEQAPDVHPTGIEQLSFKELLGLIQELPPMTRTVFNLFVFDGYPHKQIAEMMQISEGTSYWHVNQARMQLQKKIKDHQNHSYEYKRI